MRSLTFRALTALFCTTAVATFAFDAGSAQSCARASDELRSAQSVLADAMRHCDEAGAAYHACMEGNKHDGRACSAQKKAADAAMQQRRQARVQYDAAAENKRRSCR